MGVVDCVSNRLVDWPRWCPPVFYYYDRPVYLLVGMSDIALEANKYFSILFISAEKGLLSS